MYILCGGLNNYLLTVAQCVEFLTTVFMMKIFFVNLIGNRIIRFVKARFQKTGNHLYRSLIPGLLKNIRQNMQSMSSLNLFEWGRVWHKDQDGRIIEQKQLAGIRYSQKQFNFIL